MENKLTSFNIIRCYKVKCCVTKHKLKLREMMGFCTPIIAMSLLAHIALLTETLREGKSSNLTIRSLRLQTLSDKTNKGYKLRRAEL